MTSGYPWRQKIMPKNITQQDSIETANCLLMGVQCHHSGCPRYLDFGVWSQERKKCPHREMMK